MIRPTSESMTSRQAYLDSHPSLNASMDDFEAREFSPTVPDLPSQHSGFRSNNGSEFSERSSRRSYSPPAWRKAGSGWFRHQPSLSPNRHAFGSKEPSPQYHSMDEEGDGDVNAYRRATRLPLPSSPTKGRSPSNTPERDTGVKIEEEDKGGGDDTLTGQQLNDDLEPPGTQTPTESNCKYTAPVQVADMTIMCAMY